MALGDFQLIGRPALDEMARQAARSERKRVHLLHEGHGDQVQRRVIVAQPGTYVRPHRHPDQWEMLVLLQGSGNLLRFDPNGQIASHAAMSARAPTAQIPAGLWHGFWVAERAPPSWRSSRARIGPSGFAEWAPPEGDGRVDAYLRQLAPQP
jgi:cupin fold WbuC family metalloprotein